jgi:hypothetical protein
MTRPAWNLHALVLLQFQRVRLNPAVNADFDSLRQHFEQLPHPLAKKLYEQFNAVFLNLKIKFSLAGGWSNSQAQRKMSRLEKSIKEADTYISKNNK